MSCCIDSECPCPQDDDDDIEEDGACPSSSTPPSSTSSLPCYLQAGYTRIQQPYQQKNGDPITMDHQHLPGPVVASNASSCCSCPGAFHHDGTVVSTTTTTTMTIASYRASIEALAAAYGTHDHPLVARTYHLLGNVYSNDAAAHPSLAIRAYQLAVVHDAYGCGRPLADTYRKLGLAYWRAGQYASAVAFLEQALQMWQSLHVLESTRHDPVQGPATMRQLHYYMGLSCIQLEQWHRALDYLEASVRNTDDDDDHTMEALLAMTKIHCQVTGNLLAARTCCRRIMATATEDTCSTTTTTSRQEERLLLLRQAETLIQGATTTRSSSRLLLHRRLWGRHHSKRSSRGEQRVLLRHNNTTTTGAG